MAAASSPIALSPVWLGRRCSHGRIVTPSLRLLATKAAFPNPKPSNSIEVEIKLRLPDSDTHRQFSDLLSPFHVKTLSQENIFFDSPSFQLSKNLAALRFRFYDLDSQCVLSLKAKPVISGGISRVEEHEEDIDPSIGRTYVAEPSQILSIGTSSIVKRVREEYGVGELVCLGGFRNLRGVYEWKGLKLELDETLYDFGTSYEIECESTEPETDKKLIEGLLEENGISYSYSNMNKFAVFRSGKLPE